MPEVAGEVAAPPREVGSVGTGVGAVAWKRTYPTRGGVLGVSQLWLKVAFNAVTAPVASAEI